MRTAVASAIALLMTAALGTVSAQAASITSTFDSTDEGWNVRDNGSATTPSGVSSPVTYHSTGGVGNSGYVSTADIYSSNAFYAPSAYLGDLSAFYGGTFNFSLQIATADIDPGPAVVLYGAGTSIAFAAPKPGTSFTSYSANLTEAGWETYLGGQIVGGAPVTLATFQAVLGSLTAVTILADWQNGGDLVGLDSVSINTGTVAATPIPASLPLLAAALGGIGFAGWRRKKSAAA